MRTEAGRSVFLEAKIDDFVSVEQIDKYTAELPQSYGVLLVPDATAPDVVSVVEQRPELRVVCWKDLLASLALVNPIACQLEEDINRMSSLPDSKARARHMMHRALEVIGRSAPGTDQVDFELTYAQSRYPSLDLQVANTWVFGQVEPARTKGRELKFTAKVGFRTDESDQRDAASIERMLPASSGCSGPCTGPGRKLNGSKPETTRCYHAIGMLRNTSRFLARNTRFRHEDTEILMLVLRP
ncbi:hypothetical protein [Glutamicibacter sp. NPDC087344]|uniref:hypothetical protein n=1 Tax=Glutamicibacter sp. NPDC087344 TaxID=3363994 RepID=UPI00381DE40C